MSIDGRLSMCSGWSMRHGSPRISWPLRGLFTGERLRGRLLEPVPALGKPTAAWKARPRVRLVFSHIPPGQPTWPYISYDYEARKRELTGSWFTAARRSSSCP